MNRPLIRIVSTIFLLYSPGGYVESYMVGNNPHHRAETLDPEGKYQLEWLVDLEAKRVTFNITVETTGYVGFGLSSFGKMSGADIVIGGVRCDGTTYFSDRHAIGHHVPEEDPNQNWVLHSARESKTHTFLSFSRDFDTCDPQDYPITEDKISLVWAYGERDTLRYHHQNRGQYPVYLTHPDYAPQITRDAITGDVKVAGDDRNEIKVWTINTRLELPTKDTTYYCTIHKGPRLSQKHHAIGYDVRLETPEGRRHAHHILIHRCHAPAGRDAKRMFDQWTRHRGQSCLLVKAPEGPMPTEYCTEFFQSWAIGGRIFWQPDKIGIAFGESIDEYFLVQIHYDNPGLLTNVVVETKLDLYYTSQLRPIEGGIMIFRHESPGLPPSILVPPASVDHKIYGLCGSDCTKQIFPKEGITAYAVLLHTHNAGRRMKLQHFRNDKELSWIASDDTYQFNYQQYRVLNREVKVLPGDQLVAQCRYNSVRINESVVSGFSTQQEMCAMIVFYHTRLTDYMQCSSEIDSPQFRQRFLGVTNVTWVSPRLEFVVDPPHRLAGLTISEVSDNHVNWDLELREELESFQLYHPHVNRCPAELYARARTETDGVHGNLSDGTSENSEEQGQLVSYPGNAISYRPKQSCSFRKNSLELKRMRA